MGEAKKSYSIWSLLVTMTLLAVWMAVPKLFSYPGLRNYAHDVFFLFHQLVLWISCASVIWLMSGRRFSVLLASVVALIIVWGPCALWITEEVIRDSHPDMVEHILERTGLVEPYMSFYGTIHQAFGYED